MPLDCGFFFALLYYCTILILHYLCLYVCKLEVPKPRPTNPCIPSPCGPYSECRQVDDHAVCSCQKNYIGSPPACRPECMVSSECPQDKACIRQKCVDPCPGTCSPDARCQVVNHNPICSCPPGYTGDPFTRCIKQRKISLYICTVNSLKQLLRAENTLSIRLLYTNARFTHSTRTTTTCTFKSMYTFPLWAIFRM